MYSADWFQQVGCGTTVAFSEAGLEAFPLWCVASLWAIRRPAPVTIPGAGLFYPGSIPEDRPIPNLDIQFQATPVSVQATPIQEDTIMSLGTRAIAEFIGTFWLVFGGCGAAVLAAGFPNTGIGFLGVACAFGLTVLTMAYAIGHISGCHLNPAVSVGLLVGGRFPASDLVAYVAAQLAGAIAAAGALYVIASGKPGFDLAAGFASNGYAEHSPGGYSLTACLVAEVVLTFMFLIIILGATDHRAPQGFAPIAIGLGLTLIHLIGIPVTNLSVNPARSTGPALFVGGWAVAQLWLFWVAPIAGAAIAGIVYPAFAGRPRKSDAVTRAESARA
jgi:aquaporin Z